jgi:hypothetical protein
MAARGEYKPRKYRIAGDLSETDLRAWILRRTETERLNSPSHPVPLHFQDLISHDLMTSPSDKVEEGCD